MRNKIEEQDFPTRSEHGEMMGQVWGAKTLNESIIHRCLLQLRLISPFYMNLNLKEIGFKRAVTRHA